MSGDLSWLAVTLFMGFLLGISLCLERLVEFLHHVTQNKSYSQKWLKKIFEELMILGLISFFALVVTELTENQSTKLFHVFEFCHVWIFLFAVFFVVHAMLLMYMAERAKNQWNEVGSVDLDAAIAQAPTQPAAAESMNSLRQLIFGRSVRVHTLEFHICRLLFLQVQQLPSTFNFSTYLQKCLSQDISRQIHINYVTRIGTCALLLILLSLNVGCQELLGVREVRSFMLFSFAGFAWGNVFVMFTVLIISRVLKNRLLRFAGVRDTASLVDVLGVLRFTTPAVAPPHPEHNQIDKSKSRLDDKGVPDLRAEIKHFKKTQFPGKGPPGFQKMLGGASILILFQILNISVTFQCFHLALVPLLLIEAAVVDYGPGGGSVFVVVGLLSPCFVTSLFFIPRILRNLAFLDGITSWNRSIILKVNYMDEWLVKTELKISNELLNHASGLEEAQWLEAFMVQLFETMSATLDPVPYSTFRQLLENQNIADCASFSKKQWSALTRSVDKTVTGFIGFPDFRRLILFSLSRPTKPLHLEPYHGTYELGGKLVAELGQEVPDVQVDVRVHVPQQVRRASRPVRPLPVAFPIVSPVNVRAAKASPTHARAAVGSGPPRSPPTPAPNTNMNMTNLALPLPGQHPSPSPSQFQSQFQSPSQSTFQSPRLPVWPPAPPAVAVPVLSKHGGPVPPPSRASPPPLPLPRHEAKRPQDILPTCPVPPTPTTMIHMQDRGLGRPRHPYGYCFVPPRSPPAG